MAKAVVRYERSGSRVVRFTIRRESSRAQFQDYSADYEIRKANRENRKGRA